MEDHESAFEGYGYRTSSRFGSWTKVMVDGGSVSITGPRVAVLPCAIKGCCTALLGERGRIARKPVDRYISVSRGRERSPWQLGQGGRATVLAILQRPPAELRESIVLTRKYATRLWDGSGTREEELRRPRAGTQRMRGDVAGQG